MHLISARGSRYHPAAQIATMSIRITDRSNALSSSSRSRHVLAVRYERQGGGRERGASHILMGHVS